VTDVALPPDDPTIEDQWTLYRRVVPFWIVPDNAGGTKLSKQAFQDMTDAEGHSAVSVHINEVLAEFGLGALDLVSDFPGYGVAAVQASEVRECDLGVTRAPTDSDGDRGRAHAHINGPKPKSTQRRLADKARIVIAPATT
jgi:hypothetical protein